MKRARLPRSRFEQNSAILGTAIFVLAATLFLLEPRLLHLTRPDLEPESLAIFGTILQQRTLILQWGLFCSTVALAPAIYRTCLHIHRHSGLWLFMLLPCSLFLIWFIFHFGNRQFGAWDFGIVVDTGWRQILGQRPYTDFITPNPPGFNLGIYYAFRIFGVTWNAQIFAIIIFCIASFVWLYWLLSRISGSPLFALSIAFAVEGVAVLPLCFWWYNDVTSVAASIFLLSAIRCAQNGAATSATAASRADWLSYLFSLSLLCLMKPNIGGLLVVSVSFLLLVAVRNKGLFLVVTVSGIAVCLAILLVHRISIHDLIANYRAAAIERGGLRRIGFGVVDSTRSQRIQLYLWTLFFATPLVSLLPQLFVAFRRARWRELASLLIFTTALPASLYGMVSDGEVKELETSLIVVSCAVLCLTLRPGWQWMRAIFMAMVVSTLGVTIFIGSTRQRVLGIGSGTFFEPSANQPIRDNLFSSLTGTANLQETLAETRAAKDRFPGPVFMGPRLEFEYADLRIPSPTGWPVYYQPGTSFARYDEDRLTSIWESHKFQTLIFLGDDRKFYGRRLLATIDREYERQPGFAKIQVYARRP